MLDLTHYWKKKPWAKFATIDEDGFVWLFERRPVPNDETGMWYSALGRQFFVKQVDPPKSWKVAIWERPEGL